jgi:hypothetical protein
VLGRVLRALRWALDLVDPPRQPQQPETGVDEEELRRLRHELAMQREREHRRKPRRQQLTREAKRRGLWTGDVVDPVGVLLAHGGLCASCKEPINEDLRRPDPRALELHHLRPEHTPTALVPVHAMCHRAIQSTA